MVPPPMPPVPPGGMPPGGKPGGGRVSVRLGGNALQQIPEPVRSMVIQAMLKKVLGAPAGPGPVPPTLGPKPAMPPVPAPGGPVAPNPNGPVNA